MTKRRSSHSTIPRRCCPTGTGRHGSKNPEKVATSAIRLIGSGREFSNRLLLGGGCAATGLAAPAKGTGPPPRPQGCCASRWRATALRAALDPGDPCSPWEQEKRAGPGLPPPGAGATRPAMLAMFTTTEVSAV
jgi:hypothetical protein